MRVIIDTNVFISGIFFKGIPYEILKAWRDRKIELVISKEILDEYIKVGKELSKKYTDVSIIPFLNLVINNATFVNTHKLKSPVCDDTDDDKFIECAIASNTKTIISGDKHLLKVSGYSKIKVWRPRDFVERYLKK